jgi:ribosomal protein L7Ae-like RNA K-turn-binding protein
MPIERDDFFFMLGLAMRAGQLTFGEDGVKKAIASGGAKLVLLDAGASGNTKKKMRDSCAYYGVQLVETAADRLGYAVGKPGRMSAAVSAGGICDKLISIAGA